MTLSIRPATADMVGEFRNVLARTFGWDLSPDREEHFLSTWEPERSFCAFEGTTMVGTSGAFSLEMTVPDGVVNVGGTSLVAVLPTHRRRGALRQMMAAHLEDVREREEPLAALWASDSAIYGRFGYGMASLQHELTIDPRHSEFHRSAPTAGSAHLLDSDQARQAIPPIYEALRREWPGFIRRSDAWWETRWFSDHESHRHGATSLRYAVTDDYSGYLIYRQRDDWSEGHGAGEVRVVDLVASTPTGWAGLWKLALTQDLVTKVTAPLRPPDDPLFDLLAAPRRALGHRSDGVWVRLRDLPAALAGRTYRHDGVLVFTVIDPFLGTTNNVTLSSEGGTVDCRPTRSEPDLTLDIEDLSAAYLGLSRFQSLATLGRVRGDPAAIIRADQMFAWSPQPWCPEIF